MASSCVHPPGAKAVDEGGRSILGNVTSLVIGQIVAALSMWLALVALAKLSDPATVGVYALAQAICTPVAETAKMGLREIRSSDTRAAYRFGDYLGLRLIATTVALILIVGAGAGQADKAAIFWVIVLYGLTRCLEMLSDMIYALFQAHERMDYIGRSLCLRGPLSLLLLAIGYWLTGSLVGAVFGQLLAHAIVLFGYDLPMGRRRGNMRATDRLWPFWDVQALRGLALQAVPLVVASLLAMIALYLPQLALERTSGLSALGYFAALTAIAMSPSRLVQSVGMAASVRLAKAYATGDIRYFVRLLALITFVVGAFGALGVLISMAFGEPILRLVYTSDYAQHAELLTWLAAAACMRLVTDILQAGMIASRRFWWLSIQYAVVAAVALVTCFTIIPWFGLIGAGVAVLLIFCAQFVVILVGLVKVLRVARLNSQTP